MTVYILPVMDCYAREPGHQRRQNPSSIATALPLEEEEEVQKESAADLAKAKAPATSRGKKPPRREPRKKKKAPSKRPAIGRKNTKKSKKSRK